MFASKKDIKTTSGCEDVDGDFKISKMSKNLHEMFASKDISTAGGRDEDVATVNAILNSCDLEYFKFNSITGGNFCPATFQIQCFYR